MCCRSHPLDVFSVFLWLAGRWHTASSLHTTHSSTRNTWPHAQSLAVVVAWKAPASVLIMTRSHKSLLPRIVQASVILHEASFFMSVNSFLFTSHQSSASHPSPPLPLRYYVPFFSSCLFSVLIYHQRHNPFPSSALCPSSSPSIHLRLSFPLRLPTYYPLSFSIIRDAWVHTAAPICSDSELCRK